MNDKLIVIVYLSFGFFLNSLSDRPTATTLEAHEADLPSLHGPPAPVGRP